MALPTLSASMCMGPHSHTRAPTEPSNKHMGRTTGYPNTIHKHTHQPTQHISFPLSFLFPWLVSLTWAGSGVGNNSSLLVLALWIACGSGATPKNNIINTCTAVVVWGSREGEMTEMCLHGTERHL